MTVMELVKQIARRLDINLSELGIRIGRGGGSSLGRSLRDDSLKVKDLKKCLACDGEELIIIYKGKKIRIDDLN
jgi:hypothetical protein